MTDGTVDSVGTKANRCDDFVFSFGSIRGGEFNSEKVMALNETVIVPVIFYFQIR